MAARRAAPKRIPIHTFAGGVMDPKLHDRVDLESYYRSVALCRNWVPVADGSLMRRPGFQSLGGLEEDSATLQGLGPRRMFDADIAGLPYILELGSSWFRVIRNGAYVFRDTDVDFTITGSNTIVFDTPDDGNIGVGGHIVRIDQTSPVDSGLDGLDFLTESVVDDASLSAAGQVWDFLAGVPDINFGVSHGAFSVPKVLEVITTPDHENAFWAQPTVAAGANSFAPYLIADTTPSGFRVGLADPTTARAWGTFTEDDLARLVAPVTNTSQSLPHTITGTLAWRRYEGDRVDLVTATGLVATSGTLSIYAGGRHPFAAEDLDEVRFDQIGDTIIMTHVDYGAYEIRPINPASLDITEIEKYWRVRYYQDHRSSISPPTNLVKAATGPAASVGPRDYIVTAIDATTGEESEPSNVLSAELNQIVLDCTAPEIGVASGYNFYAGIDPSFSFIGTSPNTTMDFGLRLAGTIEPNRAISTPAVKLPFAGDAERYRAVGFFQNRLFLGGRHDFPRLFRASHVGSYRRWGSATPVAASDGLENALLKTGTLLHVIENQSPFFFTDNAVWVLRSADGVAISAGAALDASHQSSVGSNFAAPVAVEDVILYAEFGGKAVRELSFDFSSSGHYTDDISLLVKHLFKDVDRPNTQVRQMAYSSRPHNVLWVLMTDGRLLSMTYIRSQRIFAWATHDIQELVVNTILDDEEAPSNLQSIAVVRESGEDVLYGVTLRRTVSLERRWSVERMVWQENEDSWEQIYLDGAIQVSDAAVGPHTVLQQLASDPIEFSFAAPHGASVGDTVAFTHQVRSDTPGVRKLGAAHGKRFKVHAVPTTTTIQLADLVSGEPIDGTATQWVDPTPFFGSTLMYVPADSWGGALRYANQTVQCMADGDKHDDVAISATGTFSTTRDAWNVVIGTSFKSEMALLDPSTAVNRLGLPKLVAEPTVSTFLSRGGQIGLIDKAMNPHRVFDLPELDVPENPYDFGRAMFTGHVFPVVGSGWQENQLYLTTEDPFPLNLRGLHFKVAD